MKVHVLVALLTLVSLTYSQDQPSIRIAGTAINTTDPISRLLLQSKSLWIAANAR